MKYTLKIRFTDTLIDNEYTRFSITDDGSELAYKAMNLLLLKDTRQNGIDWTLVNFDKLFSYLFMDYASGGEAEVTFAHTRFRL